MSLHAPSIDDHKEVKERWLELGIPPSPGPDLLKWRRIYEQFVKENEASE